MAEWRSIHQQLSFRSGLETGGQSFDPPLLPYEKALIDTIGCTEEEYKTLVRHAMLRQRVRPAEYDHIPDIVNDPVTAIVVNLVVGALLAAASVLLAPKPPSFEDRKKISSKKLSDQIGPSSFNQSTNFDNSPSLAELNSPIPIPFGRRDTSAGLVPEQTGGLMFIPALVWSRIYAYGTYQAFEGVYVAGEAGVNVPDLGGILLGTSPLSALGGRDFAFYWSSNAGRNRLTFQRAVVGGTHQYGTQGGVDTGTVGRTIFTAPSGGEVFSDNFSMSYVPSGDTTFGVSTPIHNGTAYKFNWQVVSAPFAAWENNQDAKTDFRARRRKITGLKADEITFAGQRGMPGIGAAYGRHMGFTRHLKVSTRHGAQAGQEFIPAGQLPETTLVYTGDELVFKIDNDDHNYIAKEAELFHDTEVNLRDLINSAKSWRQRASNLLTIGSRWICNGSVFVVKSRKEVSNSVDAGLEVTLLCTGTQGNHEVGIPGERTVNEPLAGYDGAEVGPKYLQEHYYNLCSYNVATIRPVRREADTIEIGIRSQVWNKASGLCNFNTVPSPERLYTLDSQDINLETGLMDKYFTRSSCFSIFVRRIADAGETQEGFKRIDQIFCVQGNAPVFQYNYLRIRPQKKGYYEYRFSPLPGSFLVNSVDNNQDVIVLQSSEGVPYKRQATKLGGEIYIEKKTTDTDGSLGAFGITTQGRKYKPDGMTTIKLKDLLLSPELQSAPPVTTTTGTLNAIAPFTLDPGTVTTNISATYNTQQVENPRLAYHAWLTHYLGRASVYPRSKVAVQIDKHKPNVGNITIKVTAESTQTATGPIYIDANGGEAWEWTNLNYEVLSASGNWPLGTQFTIHAATNNVFSQKSAELHGIVNPNNPSDLLESLYDEVLFRFTTSSEQRQGSTQTTTSVSPGENRVFEGATGVADCSFYNEIQKSNESGPEHELVYVNEFITNDNLAEYDGMSVVGFIAKSSGEINGIEQLRLCCSEGIAVERLIEEDTAPSNLFADLVYYLLTSKTQGVGSVVPFELVDKDSLKLTAKYLKANQIFFDGVLEESESFRDFLYETAPLQLCTFTIKNGRFGMQPALPFSPVNHEIAPDAIKIDQIFTAGNIIEDSLQLQYIDVSQRSNIRAVVTWRVTKENDLPHQTSALLYWSDLDDANAPEQTFDLSEFCTNREQALRTARYLMSTRRRVTKIVNFKTAPDALSVQPGSYIRVITEASVYDASSNGFIEEAGNINAFINIENGTYDALLYGSASGEVVEAEIEISGNRVLDSRFHGYLFSLLTRKTDYSAYQIDSLNLEEDGLVSISAVEVPTDESGHSIVAKDVLDKSNNIFTVIE